MALGASIQSNNKKLLYDVRVKVPRILKQVSIRAANKATKKVHTETVRDISSKAGIPQQILRGSAKKGIKGRVRHNKATKSNRGARVWVGLYKIPLSKIKKGAYKLDKKTGFQTQYTSGSMHGKTSADIFVSKMRSGHVGYFVRHGDKRLPIQEVALDISQMGRRSVAAKGKQYGPLAFKKEFKRLSKLKLKHR